MALIIRPLSFENEDVRNCLEIYNHYIKNTTVTFEETELEEEQFRKRLREITGQYPFLVAEDAGTILGYAYLDAYNPRSAYRYIDRSTVYLAPCATGKGLGKALLLAIENAARAQRFSCILSLIVGENTHSLHFHEQNRYRKVGLMEQVGLKFGRRLDVFIYEKLL